MLTYTLRSKNGYLILFALAFFFGAGQCRENPCDTFGVIRDKTDLDGCGILIETQKDGLLLPLNFETLNMALLDGDTVAVSYSIEKDAMSICMAENAAVTVSCIGFVSSINCDELKDPMQVKWSREAAQAIDATEVSFIESKPRSFYMFRGKETCRLYDCTGRMLCEAACGNDSGCDGYLQSRMIKTKEPKVIYVVNE